MSAAVGKRLNTSGICGWGPHLRHLIGLTKSALDMRRYHAFDKRFVFH